MFALNLHGEEGTQTLLQSGYSYCFVVRSESQRSTLLENLGAQPGAAIVPHNGGLISNLPVWDNIVLPAQYHAIPVPGGLEDGVISLLAQCDLSGAAAVEAFLLKLPDQLTLFEKRLAGFVRAMLMDPALMIYDEIFEGLSRKEWERAGRFDGIFRLRFPQHISALVSFKEYRAGEDSHHQVIQL